MTTNRKSISVIIPVYNSQKTIVRALESVYNQSYAIDEVVIIDDESKDESKKTIEEFRKKHQIENLFYHYQKNTGPAKARNKAIQLSKGEYIAFLDADDAWVENKIEKQIQVFEEKDDLFLIGGKNSSYKGNDGFKVLSFEQLLFKNYFLTSSVMIKRSVISKVKGFPEDQKYSEDYYFWLTIAKFFKCGILNETLFVYSDGETGINTEGLSGNLWEMEKGELLNYKKLFKQNYINLFQFIFLIPFSLLKFGYRKFLKYKL